MPDPGAKKENKIEAIVLAAGRGTRMRSKLPKVLHRLAGKELLRHVLTAVQELNPSKTHVVVGFESGQVQMAFDGSAHEVNWIVQEQQLGTADAAKQAVSDVDSDSTVLIVLGDVPLITSETMRACIEQVAESSICLVSAEVANPRELGRIIRDRKGNVSKIVEAKDASAKELLITEINSGVLALPGAILRELLAEVSNDNAKKEYYLTDIVGLARKKGIKVSALQAADPDEITGVNTRKDLSELERKFQFDQAQKLMSQGVAIADPERLDVRGVVKSGIDCFIDVNVVFEGQVVLGDHVSIGSGCVISNSQLANGVRVEPNTVVDGAVIADNCIVGPFARIRPGTVLEDNVKIGNFVETKQATLGRGTKANHLAYLGDTSVGEDCNIGAGAVTCNYDGAEKHKTSIGDEVFVGTNATLVAPVEIDDGAFVAAGSTITKKVGTDELAVGRGRQRNVKGWKRPSAHTSQKE